MFGAQGAQGSWTVLIKIVENKMNLKLIGSLTKGQISLDVSEVIIACLGYFRNSGR